MYSSTSVLFSIATYSYSPCCSECLSILTTLSYIPLSYAFFIFKIFIYLNIRIKWRERDRIIQLLIHSANGCNGWGQARKKWWQVLRDSSGSLTLFAGVQVCAPSSTAFPRTLLGRWSGSGADRKWDATHLGARLSRGDFTYYATMLTPILIILTDQVKLNHQRKTSIFT